MSEEGDEIISEENAESECENRVTKLREELKACEREKGEYLDGWQRSKADYVNYKREVALREESLRQLAGQKIIRELLPVLETLDHAREHIKDLAPIENQFISILAKNGLEMIGEAGEVFDPSLHESIESVAVAEKEKENIIIEVISKGYKLGDKVLKAARVKIGSHS